MGSCNPFLKGYVEEGKFISDRPELWNRAQLVTACDRFGQSRTMRIFLCSLSAMVSTDLCSGW